MVNNYLLSYKCNFIIYKAITELGRRVTIKVQKENLRVGIRGRSKLALWCIVLMLQNPKIVIVVGRTNGARSNRLKFPELARSIYAPPIYN